MKSREHISQLKEKLYFRFIKKIQAECKEIFPTPQQGKKQQPEKNKSDRDLLKSEKLDATPKNAGNAKGEAEGKESQGLYKYMVGKGNNAIMVRSLFKNRFWWMIADKGSDMERVNFMWTQIKNSLYMDTLLCKYPLKKSGVTGYKLPAKPTGV